MIGGMAFRVAGVSVPGPSDVLGAAQTAAGWSAQAIGVAVGLPARLTAILDEVEALVRTITAVADRASALVDRAAGILDSAEQTVLGAKAVTEAAAALGDRAGTVVDATDELTTRARVVIDGAGRATSDAVGILDTFVPLAERAAPLAKRFVEEISEEEVQAAIRLIDNLPPLTDAVERDIMPILATLDRVGPDVHELLDVLKDVRHAITGIPGFRFFRRRGEEADERDDAQAAADEKA